MAIRRPKKGEQLDLPVPAVRPIHTWGGKRAGAGMKKTGRRVGFLIARGLSTAGGFPFRVLQSFLQTNHLHLFVEADDADTLSRGVQASRSGSLAHHGVLSIREHPTPLA